MMRGGTKSRLMSLRRSCAGSECRTIHGRTTHQANRKKPAPRASTVPVAGFQTRDRPFETRYMANTPLISPTSRSEEHTSELQSLMRISYAVFCLKKKKTNKQNKYVLISTIKS